ncbi:MAG: response regulator [bacterium]
MRYYSEQINADMPGHGKALVVDDNEWFRKLLVKFMKNRRKFQVIEEAANGHEAVALTQRLHPDVVLMDISMPGMSGLEAARQIKTLLPDTKIVFVTIHDEKMCQTLAGIIDVDGFVCKSTLKRDLPKILQQIKK